MTFGLASGTFDVFHIGHLMFLQECKKLCDFLIVAITSDELTFKLKGKQNKFDENQRKQLLESLRCVDMVVVRHDILDLVHICKQYNIKSIFKGSDYIVQNTKWEPETCKLLKDNDIKVCIIKHDYDGIHSSQLLDMK